MKTNSDDPAPRSCDEERAEESPKWEVPEDPYDAYAMGVCDGIDDERERIAGRIREEIEKYGHRVDSILKCNELERILAIVEGGK